MPCAGCVKSDAAQANLSVSRGSKMRVMTIDATGAHPLPGMPDERTDTALLWVTCTYDEARDWVTPVARLLGVTVFDAHLLDAENLAHPSFFDSTSRYELLVFRGLSSLPIISSEHNALRVRTRPTVFFVFPRCLVTIHAPDSRSVPVLQSWLMAASGASYRLPGTPGELMLRLLNDMVDRYLDLRQPLTDQLEQWQRRLLDPRAPFRDWYALLQARGELRKLEQLCEEQLDAIEEWRSEQHERGDGSAPNGLGTLTDAIQVRCTDLVGHIQRVLRHAQRLEESVETAVQLHFASNAHRTNDVMRTLTTITAIFMPLTLVTGIFGMNFEFIPGTHARFGFLLTVGCMALIALALVVWFRARRYLSSPYEPRRWQRRRQGPRDTAAPHPPEP
jgi:magnesium transporter